MAKGTKPLIIITGAAGFIGSAIAWTLNRSGRTDLLLVDHLGNTDKWRNLVPLAYADYMEKDDFLAALQAGNLDGLDVEAVIHMGACSVTTERDVSYLARNNFEWSKRIAEWCFDRPSPVRFIYASSAATYGDGAQGYRDDQSALESLRPLNAYGYSKQMFDLWCRGQGLLESAVGLKFFNVFGPNEYHKGDMRSMVVRAYEQILETRRVRLFKSHRQDYRDGEQLRDFLYVKDAAEAALHFLDPSVPAGIYNVGSGTARSWLDLAMGLFLALGRKPQVEFIPMPEPMRGRYQYHTQADLARLRAAGYAKPFRSLEAGIADYVKYLDAGQEPLGWSP